MPRPTNFKLGIRVQDGDPVKWIYIATSRETPKALRHGSHNVTCNYTDACLYFVSVHEMAPPQTEVANI